MLDFRYTLANSEIISEALDAISPMLDPLYDKYADMPIKGGGGVFQSGKGFSLKSFLEVCAEATLVGPQLSHVNAKTVFVNALQVCSH